MQDDNKKKILELSQLDRLTRQVLHDENNDIVPTATLRRGLQEKIAAYKNEAEKSSGSWLPMPIWRPALVMVVCALVVTIGYMRNTREQRNLLSNLDVDLISNLEMYDNFELIDNLDLLDDAEGDE